MKHKWLVLTALVVLSAGLFSYFSGNRSVGVRDDLNSAGIREEVANEIEKMFPGSETKRAAATQLARAFQMSIENPENAVLVERDYYRRGKECLMAAESIGPNDHDTSTSGRLEELVINSLQRSRAYLRYNARLSGKIFDGIEANWTSCNFDYSRLEN